MDNRDEKGRFADGYVYANSPGRPKDPDDVKEIKLLSKSYVQKKITKFMEYDFNELKEIVKNPESKVIDVMLARICQMSMKHGDEKRLEFIFNRTIGKVKEEVEVSIMKPVVIEKINGDKLELAMEENKEE